jgi:hypothetical protein
MCYRISTDSLLSFGISDITKLLRRKRHTLSELEPKFRPDSTDKVEIPSYTWTRRNSWTGETEKLAEVNLTIRKGLGGLCLEIRYSIRRDGKPWDSMCLRYDLVRRESNLKPGTYRYYFRDPYSGTDSLCSRLYFLPDIGEFVPRSLLKSYGVLYSQQRRGKKDRYFSGFTHAPSGNKLRYRKRYYRGKETPFGRRYRELSEREEYRWGLFLMGNAWSPEIGSFEGVEELLREYHIASGRSPSSFKPKTYYKNR